MKLAKLKKVVFVVSIIFLFAGFTDIYFEINKNIELFGKVYKEISFNYVDDIDPEQFMRAGIEGMLASLDPYTIFIDEKRKEDIDLITNGKYGGIGISIGVRGDKVTVVEVMDGYSAQKQGMKVGDNIIEAAGVEINQQNVDDLSSFVKGEPGTTVNLKILRDEITDTLEFDIVREEVIVKNLTFAGFYPENSNNVYLKLINFSRSAGDEVKQALRQLKSEKEIKSVVLDLRGNPGGLLDIAVDICDKFLMKELLIVSTKGRSKTSIKKYYSNQEPMIGATKLIVLINGGSASASEIVAGAIQDHDRGVILGTRSFGKGLVQTISPLSYNTSLKITTAKYYTPSGRCIQEVDYSDNNDVIAAQDSIIGGEFLTDNNRVVLSKGGITPDSVIQHSIGGKITRELLAHGMIFKFSNHYYYQNSDLDINNIDESKLLDEFKIYAEGNEFTYKSDAENHLSMLIDDIDDNYTSLAEELKNLKTKISDLKKDDFELHRNEIIAELKEELAVRYNGIEGRIKQQLQHDPQFQAAIEIMQNSKVYEKLLNSN